MQASAPKVASEVSFEVFNEGKTEWEEKGDSDIYYWTDWS